MKIRFGYVAISLNLPNVTTSSTLTFTRYNKILNSREKIDKLKAVTQSNINDLKTIIEYNIENKIHFYRMTSKLIPLATHPEVEDWNYDKFFNPDLKIVGKLINKSNMRIDTHPDQFNVINSHREEVFKKTIINLEYHMKMFELMNIKNPKMVIHVGGSYGGKEEAIKRFIKNFRRMPKYIQKAIILENDDKIFNIEDTLYICKELSIPMVLDIHHHWCNGMDSLDINRYIIDILKTWDNENYPPKIHLSTPKDNNNDRKHADFISVDNFLELLEIIKDTKRDVDIMLECKKKDIALFKLIDDIKHYRKNLSWFDKTTLNI